MLIFLLSACFVMDGKVDTPVDPSVTTTQVFEVPAGSTAGGLAKPLAAAGLIEDELAWKYFLKSRQAGSCLKAGKFELSPSMNMPQLMEVMCGAPLADELPFTVVEGWRVRDIDAALVDKGWIDPGEFTAAASDPSLYDWPFEQPKVTTMEGFLLPDTYMVPAEEFEPQAFIQRQLDTFGERFVAAHDGNFGERSLYDVLIVASMLEREEPKPSQRTLVAGIIWKRLDNDWQLGIDATSHYKLDEWNDRKGLLRALKDESDPYNTRLLKGLPPTPIGNPSLPSLEAALVPEESPYWFYLHDSQGVLHPARNGAEHERNRAKYGVY